MFGYEFKYACAVSADDLLADLKACRQLRHVSMEKLMEVVGFFFGDIEHSLREGKRLPGTNCFFVQNQLAFEEAISVHGVCCDICGIVLEVPESKWRYAATRVLENLDRDVKLVLCEVCDRRFVRFCEKHFQRTVRIPWSRDLEQMMLAFIASEVGLEARRLMSGRPPRKRADESSQSGSDSHNRKSFQARLNYPRSLTIDWNPRRDGSEISEGIRQ